jgi:hypothetical protein
MDEERDARWQEILEAQSEIVDEPVPLHRAREDRAARPAERKSQRFAEALSDLGSWSSVEAPKRRLSA